VDAVQADVRCELLADGAAQHFGHEGLAFVFLIERVAERAALERAARDGRVVHAADHVRVVADQLQQVAVSGAGGGGRRAFHRVDQPAIAGSSCSARRAASGPKA
jgi:glycerate kinase